MLTVLNVAYPLAPVGRDAVGGAEQILAALDEAIADAGHRSIVLGCAGSSAAGKLYTCPPPRGEWIGERLSDARRRYRRIIDRIVATDGVDVVHAHGVDFIDYLPASPVPVLATLHLPCSWYPRAVFATERPRTYLNCVSMSQRRECPRASALIGEVPNGVDLTRFRPGARGETALVLGRICAEKGAHLALEAARRARVPLVIAGQVFPYPEHLRYFRREIRPRLDARRRFIGPIKLASKAGLLASARCLVVPSTAPETSSLAALEALACGTPVVAFAVGALPELIEHGVTGFLVDDVEQMAEALVRAPAIRSDACRASAERFPIEATCRRYLDLYRWMVR